MAETPLNLSGLAVAIRLKADLLHNLVMTSPTAWPNHLARFVAALEVSDLEDTTALLVLVAELREEVRLLTGSPSRREAAGETQSTASASEAMTKTEILTQFRVEVSSMLAGSATARITSPIVEQMTRFIDEHHAEPLTLDGLAAAMGRSKRYLATLFRTQTGQTVHRYLIQVRVHHAATLVRKGEKIEAVSLLVGYKSKKNFYRHFKNQIGVTPLVYKTALIGVMPRSGA